MYSARLQLRMTDIRINIYMHTPEQSDLKPLFSYLTFSCSFTSFSIRVLSETQSPYFLRLLPFPKSLHYLYFSLSFCNIFLLIASFFLKKHFIFFIKLLTNMLECAAVFADHDQQKRPFCLRHIFSPLLLKQKEVTFMFKPELWQSHNEYRTLVTKIGRRLSRNNHKYSFDSYEEEYQKLLNLNLDPLAQFIPPFYSNGGRPATHQAQILRSLILFVLLFNETKAHTSLTLWVRKVLPESISLTVLIGCASTDELPPLGSYYDFMNRFWLAPRNSYSRSSLLPAGKNGKKPKKEIGPDGKLIEPQDPSSITTRDIVNSIQDGKPASENPEAALQKIFSILAVFPSLRLGLLDSHNLTVSGDGTAVVSHTSPYGRHLPTCGQFCPYRGTCDRHYSDPDAGWGWDSDKKTWYFGHTLYMLCTRNNTLKIDLPLLMKFTDAKRHDCKNFLYTIDDFGRNTLGLSPKNICLDSAHDNIPTYELLERWDMNALIDINGRTKASENAPKDITFNKEGHPICRAGHEMCSWGNDPISTNFCIFINFMLY